MYQALFQEFGIYKIPALLARTWGRAGAGGGRRGRQQTISK